MIILFILRGEVIGLGRRERERESQADPVRWWPEPQPRVGHWTDWATQVPPQRPKFLTEISLLTYIEGNLENWKHRAKQTKLTDGSAEFLLLFWHNLVQFRTPVQEYQVSSIIFLVKIWPRQYLAHQPRARRGSRTHGLRDRDLAEVGRLSDCANQAPQ